MDPKTRLGKAKRQAPVGMESLTKPIPTDLQRKPLALPKVMPPACPCPHTDIYLAGK